MPVDSYRVQISRRASAQLEAIFEYIAQDSPDNAGRLIGRLLDAIDGLDIFPHRFPVIEQSFGWDDMIRSIPVRPYLVRYTVDDVRRVVTILSIRHAAKDEGF